MDAAAIFRSAIADLETGMDRQRQMRPELAFEHQPPPRRLAPFAAAIGATVHEHDLGRGPGGEAPPGAADDDADTEVGRGSFVLLYDPAGQTGWAGPFRVIAYVRAELEPEIAADPLIGQVGWSWLTEALDTRTTGYQRISGTVTRVVTEGFGTKQAEPVATGFELRASWSPARPGAARPAATLPTATLPTATPTADAMVPAAVPSDLAPRDLGGHVAAWCDALCAAAGLPPLPAGVSALRPRPRRRP
jgi:Protein of unknown function (DUF3000)